MLENNYNNCIWDKEDLEQASSSEFTKPGEENGDWKSQEARLT